VRKKETKMKNAKMNVNTKNR